MSSKMIGSEPIGVAGGNIQVIVRLDMFWCVERAARDALSVVRGNSEAEESLQTIMNIAGSAYAEGRRDDPRLPSYYRRYLKP